VALAQQVLGLYGTEGLYLNYPDLQAEVLREQARLVAAAAAHHTLRLHTVRPRYRQLHPSRHLETIHGVGQDGAAIFASFTPAHTAVAGWRSQAFQFSASLPGVEWAGARHTIIRRCAPSPPICWIAC
jgi:hypothetical protein